MDTIACIVIILFIIQLYLMDIRNELHNLNDTIKKAGGENEID